MNTFNWSSIAVALLLALTTARGAAETNLVRYSAQPVGSKVRMEGTSTIHDWTMEGALIGGAIEADAGFPQSALTNAHSARPAVQAIIPVRSLKSYAKRMDEVMQEHMNAVKYPRIEYRLVELKARPGATAEGALQFDAIGALTVAGVTRTNTMPVNIAQLDGGKLKITGSTALRMTDFGVQPPAPSILGMPVIKTGDDIKISFEWLTAAK